MRTLLFSIFILLTSCNIVITSITKVNDLAETSYVNGQIDAINNDIKVKKVDSAWVFKNDSFRIYKHLEYRKFYDTNNKE